MKKAAFGLFIIVFASCIRIKEQYTVLARGIWRGVLELEPPTIKANTGEPADSEPENQNDGVYIRGQQSFALTNPINMIALLIAFDDIPRKLLFQKVKINRSF